MRKPLFFIMVAAMAVIITGCSKTDAIDSANPELSSGAVTLLDDYYPYGFVQYSFTGGFASETDYFEGRKVGFLYTGADLSFPNFKGTDPSEGTLRIYLPGYEDMEVYLTSTNFINPRRAYFDSEGFLELTDILEFVDYQLITINRFDGGPQHKMSFYYTAANNEPYAVLENGAYIIDFEFTDITETAGFEPAITVYYSEYRGWQYPPIAYPLTMYIPDFANRRVGIYWISSLKKDSMTFDENGVGIYYNRNFVPSTGDTVDFSTDYIKYRLEIRP